MTQSAPTKSARIFSQRTPSATRQGNSPSATQRTPSATQRTPSATQRALRLTAPLAALLVALSLSGAAQGQASELSTGRLPAYGRSVSSTDDSSALVLNPANIGFMPGSELRWSGLFAPSDPYLPPGHAFSFATPLFFGLSSGLRVDLVGDDRDTQGLTWALAATPSDALSLGYSLQRISLPGNDFTSHSLALTSRPAPALSVSVVGQNLGSRLPNTLNTGFTVLPLGSRAVELGFEALFAWVPQSTGGDREVDITPRFTLGLGLGSVGKAFGAISVLNDKAAYGTVGLSFYPSTPGGSTEFTVGSVGERAPDPEYLFGEVALRGFRERPGAEVIRTAVRLRLESTADARGHVRLLRKLWALAEEPRVDAVLLELRTSPAASFAHAQELRDALYHLRSNGKRVLCHLEDGGGVALYVCSAANKTLINPAGGLRFAGLKAQSTYLAGMLTKLGIRADFVRIGDHKSAPERLMRTGSTDVARADRKDLLQQLERQLVEGVAAGRSMSPKAVRESIASGPHIASEALTAKFVDGLAFDDELPRHVRELTGRDTELLRDGALGPARPRGFRGSRSIAVVYVDGDMVDGRSATIPLLGMRLVGSYTVAEALKQAREDGSIGAVILRVETPGGSAMAADVIWREAELTAQVKPLVVSMGSYAASAGYYISAPAERIFANPASITGSIGVFYGKADVAGLMEKIGVTVETAKTAPRADAESLFRPFTPEERVELNRKVGQFYDTFLTRVSAGRKLSKAEVDKVARGRVWTGEQARDRRLVDELGGLRQAIAYVTKQANLADDAPLVELPVIQTSLLGELLGIEGLRADMKLELPAQLRSVVHALGPFFVYEGDKPLMRLEQAPIRP
ncbi:MAG: signal peptide peptidase SppA [Polyangiaceae bacterium]|nr:signal peptide peptidase SppA [Polyangiaceae bacterium]MCW5792097.1 signal peptide peptidase SppA [Polyangiaceae bacterium]